jgi:hypothetical protein
MQRELKRVKNRTEFSPLHGAGTCQDGQRAIFDIVRQARRIIVADAV